MRVACKKCEVLAEAGMAIDVLGTGHGMGVECPECGRSGRVLVENHGYAEVVVSGGFRTCR